jgi:PIN domain nuclease of toxin-antitoxin system
VTECLDSWAVLAWLEGEEPAASRVQEALVSRPVMSWINVGEVAYVVE